MTVEELRERLVEAEQEASESSKMAMNSYGAGYDRGFVDALRWVLEEFLNAPDT